MNSDVDATPAQARARVTGIAYLFYFLLAVGDQAFVSRSRPVVYIAVDLLAYALYIIVTLRFYYMFRPVNASLSLLAALFSVAGCANDVLGLFDRAPYDISSLAFFGP
jgi:hypothetical protein